MTVNRPRSTSVDTSWSWNRWITVKLCVRRPRNRPWIDDAMIVEQKLRSTLQGNWYRDVPSTIWWAHRICGQYEYRFKFGLERGLVENLGSRAWRALKWDQIANDKGERESTFVRMREARNEIMHAHLPRQLLSRCSYGSELNTRSRKWNVK
jgi:hypothetical protein